MRRTEIPRKAVALAMTTAVLVIALASIGQPVPAAADLGDGHTRAHGDDNFPEDFPQLTDEGRQAYRKAFQLRNGRITRNLVKGETLDVCSDVFPKATEDAVDRWNDALPRKVLTFKGASSECQRSPSSTSTGWTPEEGVVAVFVSLGQQVLGDRIGGQELPHALPEDEKYTCPDASFACVRQDHIEGSHGFWRTQYGRVEVIVHPDKFCRDTGIPSGTHGCGITQDDDELRYLLTHELGHALSLGDYYCNHLNDAREQHPDFVGPNMETVMNTFSLRRDASLRECNAPKGNPTTLDINDYVKIYTPATVVVDGPDVDPPKVEDQTVILHWDQSEVFVESGFEVLRWDEGEGGWVEEATAGPNAPSATLTNQPSGEQRYRIRARTMALPEEGAGHGHAHGPHSAIITVSVPLPAPTGPTVTARTPVRLTLSWTAGVGASFHEVKATTRANCNEKSETYETPSSNSATSHPLTGLTPNTSYRLCVRSVRTIGSDSVRSAWAETTATMTTAKLAAPSTRAISNSDITTNTITLRWSEVTDADGYEVKATKRANCEESETYGTPNPRKATSHPFPNLDSNTNYRLCVRATLDAHSAAKSAWASRSAKTTTAPSPPVTPDPLLPPIRCLSSTKEGASATYMGRCNRVLASWLLDAVRQVNSDVCGIWRLRGGAWRDRYGVAFGGGVAHGSTDYTIDLGNTLWLAPGNCNSASGSDGAGGASSAEPPACSDALKPASGPTVIDADSTDCATVRGGGSVQISRGDYTLNLTLSAERDWWALAPTSYHDNPSGAFLFVDLSTGGWLALNPADGAELARHAPIDAEGVSALLDAVGASAFVPAAGE